MALNSGDAEVSLHAYMATALTGLDEPKRNHVGFLSDLVRNVCEKHGIILYQPRTSETDISRPDTSAEKVYEIDRERVVNSDLVLMLCDYPSFGAGQELEIAAQAGVPVVLVRHRSTKLSRMVLGTSAAATIIDYDTPEELRPRLDDRLGGIVPELRLRRLGRESTGVQSSFGARLTQAMFQKGLTPEKLGTLLGVSYSYVRMLQEKPERVSSISLTNLRGLSRALDISLVELLGLDTASSVARSNGQAVELEDLLDVANGEDATVATVIKLWSRHKKDAANRGQKMVARMTKGSWRTELRRETEREQQPNLL